MPRVPTFYKVGIKALVSLHFIVSPKKKDSPGPIKRMNNTSHLDDVVPGRHFVDYEHLLW